MSRLTRDRTAEPASRDHILKRKRGQGKKIPVQPNTKRIGNHTRLIVICCLLFLAFIHTLLKGLTIHPMSIVLTIHAVRINA